MRLPHSVRHSGCAGDTGHLSELPSCLAVLASVGRDHRGAGTATCEHETQQRVSERHGQATGARLWLADLCCSLTLQLDPAARHAYRAEAGQAERPAAP